jgi:hypothetical protein
MPLWFRQSPSSQNEKLQKRPAFFSPFTGRSARQGDEGLRRRSKYIIVGINRDTDAPSPHLTGKVEGLRQPESSTL